MGDPKRLRKRYNTPAHPWISDRIKEENKLVREFGLKNKKEVWKAKSKLDAFRQQARSLRARLRTNDPQAVKERDLLLAKLTKLGLVRENATLDDVLLLKEENILSRRLQSQVYMKGLAHTMKQARQLIVHGHIAIGDRKVTIPGYIVRVHEEQQITYAKNSPLTMEEHPARPKRAGTSTSRSQVERTVDISTPAKEEKKEEAAEKPEETASEASEEKKE